MLDWGPEGERPFSRQRLWLEFKPLVFRSWYFLLCQTVLSFLCSFSTYTTYYSNHSHWNRKSAHDLIALEYFPLTSNWFPNSVYFLVTPQHSLIHPIFIPCCCQLGLESYLFSNWIIATASQVILLPSVSPRTRFSPHCCHLNLSKIQLWLCYILA